MTSQSKRGSNRQRDLTETIIEKKPGEKWASIVVYTMGAELRCMIPHCDFHVNVSRATVPVMVRELRDYYADHRKHRHAEYCGRTEYEETLGEDWSDGPKA